MENQNKIILYKSPSGEFDIDVKLENETVWLTQSQMAQLFQTSPQNITVHLKNIFSEGELIETATCKDFLQVQKEGERLVNRRAKFYNLDVIISVGYRVKSFIAVNFRIWATQKLTEFIVKGFVVDDARLSGTKNNYFDELSERVRAIRTSERNFWLKVTGVFSTSIDYDKNTEISKLFFANVQNMFHYAIHGHTAAELMWERADSDKINMGLATWSGDKICKEDVHTAKNYLTELELKKLNLLVEQYLSFAELQSIEQRPMYMKDWFEKLKGFFILNDKPILTNYGKISAMVGKQKTNEEYQKYEKQRQEYLKNNQNPS